MGITSKHSFIADNSDLHYRTIKQDDENKLVTVKELYLMKGILKTIKSIEYGSVTLIKQDNHIIQVDIKEIMDLSNFS